MFYNVSQFTSLSSFLIIRHAFWQLTGKDCCQRCHVWAELSLIITITERYKCRTHMLSWILVMQFHFRNFPSSKPIVYILTEISKLLKFSEKYIYPIVYILTDPCSGATSPDLHEGEQSTGVQKNMHLLKVNYFSSFSRAYS